MASSARSSDQEEKEQRSCQEGPWARAAHPLHQLCPLCPQGQGHQEVRHQEHCGGSGREGHLRGQRLWLWVAIYCLWFSFLIVGVFGFLTVLWLFCSLRSAQALCEAALLCQLCHPQQGGEEPLLRGQEGPYPSTQVQARCKYRPAGKTDCSASFCRFQTGLLMWLCLFQQAGAPRAPPKPMWSCIWWCFSPDNKCLPRKQ